MYYKYPKTHSRYIYIYQGAIRTKFLYISTTISQEELNTFFFVK